MKASITQIVKKYFPGPPNKPLRKMIYDAIAYNRNIRTTLMYVITDTRKIESMIDELKQQL